MGYIRGLDHSSCFQFNWLSADMIEQADTCAEQYGYEVNLYFVKKSSFHELLSGIRAASYHDIFVTCGCFCLFKGAFYTVSDEGGAFLH